MYGVNFFVKKSVKIIIGILAVMGILGIAATIFVAYVISNVDYKYTGQQLLDEVNHYRESKKLPQLILDPVLCDNLVERYLAIKKPDSGHKGFEEWLKSEGIKTSSEDNSRYLTIGELYIKDTSTPSNAIDFWISSPGHKSTLELPELTNGCAYANDGTGVVIMAEPTKR